VEFISIVVADPVIIVEFMAPDMPPEAIKKWRHYKLGNIHVRSLGEFSLRQRVSWREAAAVWSSGPQLLVTQLVMVSIPVVQRHVTSVLKNRFEYQYREWSRANRRTGHSLTY
jgi:hypothetical protein